MYMFWKFDGILFHCRIQQKACKENLQQNLNNVTLQLKPGVDNKMIEENANPSEATGTVVTDLEEL